MLETVKAFVASHPYVSAYVAIAVVSIALRIAGSTWWAGVKARHPKVAGLIEIARGAGFDAPKILQGVLRIAYAMLPPPVGGAGSGGAKPPAKPESSSGAAYRVAIAGLELPRPRAPRVPLPGLGRLAAWALPISLGVTLAGGLLIGGCPRQGARSPALEQSAAVVTLGAEVVHVADEACAAAGKRLRELGDPAKAAALTGRCSAALRPAADALEAVATALDAGAAVRDEQLACAVALGVDAVVQLRPVLADVGVKLPARAESFVTFSKPWIAVAEGVVCK